jgi:hypothetical protein
MPALGLSCGVAYLGTIQPCSMLRALRVDAAETHQATENVEMGKSSRRENRRNRKKDPQVPLSGLKVAVATTPGSSSSLSVVKELELVKAAVLYADQVSLLSPVAALTLGVYQLTTSDDEQLLDFMFGLDDRTLSRIGVSPQRSEALRPLKKLTLQYGAAHLAGIQLSPLTYEDARDMLARDTGQDALNRMRQDLLSDLGLQGGTELHLGVASGLVKVSDGSLPVDIASNDELIRIYVDTLVGMLRDPSTHLIFDDSTGTLVRALVDGNKINPQALSLAHAKNVSIGSGLIRKLPAFTAAPMDEILDLRREANGSLSRYRRAVASLTPKIASAAFGTEFNEEVNDIWLREVEPAIDEIKETLADHTLVRETARHLSIDLKSYVFAASGPFVAVGVQSLSTLDTLMMAAVAATPAALAGVQLLAGADRDRRAELKQAQKSDLFYLYDLGSRLEFR